jgi:hypothetical protein
LQQLPLRLDCTRPCHHDKIAAADLDTASPNDAAGAHVGLGYEIEARELAVPFGIHEWRPAILRSCEQPITTKKLLNYL